MFGPAAAWGAGIGNIIADALGGMLTPVSIVGFFGNVIYGFLPYSLWRTFMGRKNPVRSGAKGWFFYGIIIVVSCMATASAIGWGADVLRFAPFAALGLIIAVNNLIACSILASVLLVLLYSRVERWGLLYFQILDDGDELDERRFRASKLAWIGAFCCIVGASVAFFSGLLISGEMLNVGYGAAGYASAEMGSTTVTYGVGPWFLVLLAGMLLL
jgi:energy-coupling factor transport system substrate-specific component